VIKSLLVLLLSIPVSFAVTLEQRKLGLVMGSFLGEAYGGPTEFLPQVPLKVSSNINEIDWEAYANELKLERYDNIDESDYGHWNPEKEKGTLTDEARHKFLYWRAKKTREGIAKSYVAAYNFGGRWKSWLKEYAMAANWILGVRDLELARPLDRLWGGMPTQSGQMIFLFESINFVDRPLESYQYVWELNWFDIASAKDTTSSIVALGSLLLSGKSFEQALLELRSIDPFGYSEVPYVNRKLLDYIDLGLKISAYAGKDPHKLMALLESNVPAKTWWEDFAPLIIGVAVMDFSKDLPPLAALRLAIDFGHDTDSTAQLVGAWIGAIHGADIFRKSEAELVEYQLYSNFDIGFLDFVNGRAHASKFLCFYS
jgi:hypothetical protein